MNFNFTLNDDDEDGNDMSYEECQELWPTPNANVIPGRYFLFGVQKG